jgi:hypothetical protein
MSLLVSVKPYDGGKGIASKALAGTDHLPVVEGNKDVGDPVQQMMISTVLGRVRVRVHGAGEPMLFWPSSDDRRHVGGPGRRNPKRERQLVTTHTRPAEATRADQLISPFRSTSRPDAWPGPSVASETMASVPSVTVCGPALPLRSVAV